jgi:WD40 repeat protein
MVERKPQTSIIADNERSLRSLGRAIALSNNQFSVVVVCCNYKVLQQRILQRLEEVFTEAHDIQKLVLPHNARSLYTTLHTQLTKKQPSALMILGLESVDGLDDLLRAINHIRDEFRKRHSFPMVFWVNDEVQQKLLRLAPDFASWAATPIRFEMTSVELLQFLQQETDCLFATVLNTRATQRQGREADRHCTVEQVWEHSYELKYAIKELQNHGISLEPELDASLEFVFGLDDYVSDRINLALDHFQESLRCWQELSENQKELSDKFRIPDSFGLQLDIVNSHASPLLRQGVLLFYIGLCCCRLAERNYAENRRYWNSAKLYFQNCLNVLQVSGRPDVAAQFIGDLAEVLQHLQQWQELQMVAQKSLELHQTYGTQIQLACDYGFLAQVAVQESRWAQASQYARVSLWKLYESKDNNDSHQGIFPLLLAQSYRLLLAKAQRKLGEEKIALEQLKMASENLDEALESSDHRYDAHRYIRLLRSLRSLYFEEGRYLEAFTIRQKRRSVEQQYGFRAFIGAGRLQPQRQATNPALLSPSGGSSVALEIAASGREGDINNLIGRISRADQKLTVIHGPSGVGKSSTVTAGLVPALQNRAIGDQIAIPVVLQLYDDWVRELGKSLAQAQTRTKGEAAIDGEILPFPATPITIAGIQQQLQENANNHLITVLIFDQFEEFFFGNTDRNKKQEFDIFISQALNIPFVKVILSLREDYLHRLLEFKHLSELEAINKNILDKNIRYPLNNFSPKDAKMVMQRLTERSHIYLESALIDALIEDLSAELGEVRPIELQVAGAQLQDERITSLENYQPYRPNRLIERYIKELIQDCGKENERAALLVLYLLTDENNQRPFKSRVQLAIELEELEDIEKLDLVLEILVRSGLVVLFPDVPERYQLIHDYLVDLIRHLQQQESSLQIQLNQLRSKVEQSQTEIDRLNSELRQNKQQAKLVGSHLQQGLDLLSELKELRKREEMSRVEIEQLQAELKEKELITQLAESQEKQKLSEVQVNVTLKFALAVSITAIVGLTASIWTALNSEIKTISASSEALFASDKGIDAIRESLKAGRKLQKTIWVDSETREQVKTALYQSVYEVRERNRLEKHLLGVNSVTFSPNGQIIASASADNKIILWHPDGSFWKNLTGHENVVNSVSFSPDGQIIASASQDKTVKLWSLDETQPITLSGHQDVVNSAMFSPDGKFITSASKDKTIKLWSRNGKLLRTLEGHEKPVLDVVWSPDGQIISSASADKTIRLWSIDGKLIKILRGHKDAVKSLAWSPDGKIIASGSLDRTINLWSREGMLLKPPLSGHSGGVTSVSFTHDGKIIASASSDETIKLWTSQGMPLGTLKGHNNWVNSVIFSPDDRTLASASRDKTIKLWHWDDLRQGNPKSENDWITNISFSPDGSAIASANRDNTVKLWHRDGTPIRTLEGHTDQVWGVSFSPDSRIASASFDKTVKIWSLDGKLLNTLKGHTDGVFSVAWSPDGEIVASASKDKTVKLWSRDGKLRKTLRDHENEVNWVSFSPDGQLLASASDDNTVRLWHRDGTLIKTLAGHEDNVNWVSFSPDGQLLASASDDNTVRLWRRDGTFFQKFEGNGDWFKSVSFSRDGKTLAGSTDDNIKLWNRDGTLLIALKAHNENFSSAIFSPDGRQLAIGSTKGRLILHNLADIKLENLLSRSCNLLHNYLKTNPKVTKSDRALCPRW